MKWIIRITSAVFFLLDFFVFISVVGNIEDIFSVAVRDRGLRFYDKVDIWLYDVREFITIPTIILFTAWAIMRAVKLYYYLESLHEEILYYKDLVYRYEEERETQ